MAVLAKPSSSSVEILNAQGISERLPHHTTGRFHHISDGVSTALKTIYNATEAVFKGLFYCVTFPLRYVGATDCSLPGLIVRTPFVIFKKILSTTPPQKTLKQELFNSGTSTTPELASKEEAKKHLKRLAIAAFAHSSNPEWVESFGYQMIDPRTLGIEEAGVEVKPRCFFDPQTGLKIVLAEKGDEIAVGFGAIGSDRSETPDIKNSHKKMQKKQDVRAVLNLIGADLALFQQAESLVGKLLKSPYFQNKQVVFSGQCLGGALAQSVALKYKRKAYCYNSLQIGAGVQWSLGSNALTEATDYVTHLFAKGDFLNDWRGGGVISQTLSRIGIRTPGNFGKRFYIPSAYTERVDTHNYCFGSLVEYLGFDKRAKPKDLPVSMLS